MRSAVRIGLLALSLSLAGFAGEGSDPAPQRTLLLQHQQSGVPDKDIVLGTATLPPGTSVGFHVHPGDEIGYVLTGTLILRTRGEPDRLLKAGDTFFNARGAVHSLASAAGGEVGTVVSTWIVDKDKPLATAVP
jgi:quercetin dioxygenase-like cupin family protein